MHIGIFSPGFPKSGSLGARIQYPSASLSLTACRHSGCPLSAVEICKRPDAPTLTCSGREALMGYSWCLVVLVCYLVWSFCVGPLGRVTINLPTSSTSVCGDSSLKSHRARPSTNTAEKARPVKQPFQCSDRAGRGSWRRRSRAGPGGGVLDEIWMVSWMVVQCKVLRVLAVALGPETTNLLAWGTRVERCGWCMSVRERLRGQRLQWQRLRHWRTGRRRRLPTPAIDS